MYRYYSHLVPTFISSFPVWENDPPGQLKFGNPQTNCSSVGGGMEIKWNSPILGFTLQFGSILTACLQHCYMCMIVTC